MLNSVNQIAIQRALNFNTDDHAKYTIPTLKILSKFNTDWDKTKINKATTLIQKLKLHTLTPSLLNIVKIMHNYNFLIAPSDHSLFSNDFWKFQQDASWDDAYMSL